MKSSAILPILLLGLTLSIVSCKQEPAVDFKRTDNSVVLRIEADADRLNPLLSTNIYGRVVYEQIFSYLIVQDPETGAFIPQLAANLPVRKELPDGNIAYTLEIRPEATWDDGTPVTAADYVFTIKAALNPSVPAQRIRPFLAFIKDIQTDPSNPRKFTVISEKYILSEEAIALALPVMQASHYDPQGLLRDIPLATFIDPAAIEQLAASDSRLNDFATTFVTELYSRDSKGVTGSGPYRLDSWETGQRIVLVKKENWWGEKLSSANPSFEAGPDQITFKVIADAVTALSALKAEEIDAISLIEPKDFLDLQQTDYVKERYTLSTFPAMINYFVYVNTTKPKLSDKLVRKALAHAINPQEIIDNVFYGFGSLTNGPVHPSLPYYHQGLKPFPHDIEKAKALLAQAGWKDSDNNGIVDKEIDGQRVELTLSYLMAANREVSKNVALLLQDNAKKAGIGIELVAKEPNMMFDDLKKLNYEIASGGRSLPGSLWDPKQSWHTQGDNRTGFGNPKTDALIDELRVTLDEKKRNELYRRLQEIIYDEQAEIYLFVPQDRVAVHKRFEVTLSSSYPGYIINRLRLKK
jgi:peptide/nickel transport system substrate-binding protein